MSKQVRTKKKNNKDNTTNQSELYERFCIYKTSEILIKEEFRKTIKQYGKQALFEIDMEDFGLYSDITGCYNCTNILFSQWAEDQKDLWKIYKIDERNRMVFNEEIEGANNAFLQLAHLNGIDFQPFPYESTLAFLAFDNQFLPNHKDKLLIRIKNEIESAIEVLKSQNTRLKLLQLKEASIVKETNILYLENTKHLLETVSMRKPAARHQDRRFRKNASVEGPNFRETKPRFTPDSRIHSALQHNYRGYVFGAKGRVSRQRRDKRHSSHWKLTKPTLVSCPSCGALMRPNSYCPECGQFIGRRSR